jgi:hypothetical protein
MVHNLETGARYGEAQVPGRFLAETGCSLNIGFAKVTNLGGARTDLERPAGFMEWWQTVECTLAMDAAPMAIESEPVALRDAGKVAFALSVGFGNGSPLPQPSGKYNLYVNGVFCLAIRNVNHSFTWRGENSEFAFAMRRCETAPPYCGMDLSPLIQNEAQVSFGIGLLVVDASLVAEGEPARITVEPICEYPSKRYIYLSYTPNIMFQSHIWHAAEVLKSKSVGKASGYNVYFGDIHTHSGQTRERNDNQGCGMGSMEDNYRYAKGPGGLHFYALTDHERQILPGYQDAYFALADKFNADGEFACLKAFEFTSVEYGHRNVYFRDKAKAVNVTDENGAPTTPHGLARELAGYDWFSIPHHTSSASHPFNTGVLLDQDKCVEIYSAWGSSEYWGDFPRGVSDRLGGHWASDMMKARNVIGFVASADGHDGHPGAAQAPYPKHKHLFHFCGSGLTAVLCDNLTREEVYEAIRARRCYATTGTPIILDATCDGRVMGSVTEGQKTPPEFVVSGQGTNALQEIRVVRNGTVIYTHPCHGAHTAGFTYVDPGFDGSAANYYIRVVQEDRESAWSSPFFFI